MQKKNKEHKYSGTAGNPWQQAFHSLVESFPDSFIQYDCDGRIRYLNRKLALDLEVDAQQVIGRLPIEIWPDGRYADIDVAVRRAIDDGRSSAVEFCRAINTPAPRYHQIHVAPQRDAAGQVVGAFAFGYDLTELKRYGRFLDTLIDTLPDLVWLKDADGVFQICNARFEQMFGASKAEIIGKTDYEFVDRDQADGFREHDRIAMRAGTPCINEEWVTFASDGHRELLETIKTPMRGLSGDTVGVLGVARDITERKRIEQALLLSEQEFRSLAENSPDNIVRYDRECRKVYANPHAQQALQRLLGRCPIGETPTEAFPDGSFEDYQRTLRRVMDTGQTEDFELLLRDRDGAVEYHMIRMAAEKTAAGDIAGAVIFGRDVTAMRQREHLLRHIVDNLPGLACTYRLAPDGQGAFVYLSRGVEALYGVTSQQALEQGVDMQTFIHPADRPQVAAAFADSARELTPIRVEYRVRRPDLSERWLAARFAPERQADGAILWYGVVLDISERKRARQRLYLLEYAMERMHDGSVLVDRQARILDINRGLCDLLGYRKQELLARPLFAIAPHLAPDTWEANWQTIAAGGGAQQIETVSRARDGRDIPTEVSVNQFEFEGAEYALATVRDITERKHSEAQLRHLAYHDLLTGLPNRLLLTDRLSQAIAQARRSDRKVAILYLDLDGFKPINDRHGHEFGDRILVEIARRLSASLRAGDTLSRIGGDEFVALLTGFSDTNECELTAHRLLEAVSRPMAVGGQVLTFTVSIGICLFPDDRQDDADILLRYADQAMYLAKSGGRNQFVFFDSYARGRVEQQHQTVHDLRLALNDGRISVHYQPIVDLASGRIVKAEALVRWRHPTRGMVPPSEFIPVAENGGLIHEVGDLVFRQALHLADRCSRSAGRLIRIGINRSPRQFFHRNGVDHWQAYLDEHDLPGDLLAVEITEGLLLDDRPEVLQQLNQLRALGMTIALDDFGTGYSALSYLRKFHLDDIKIDRSFIRDIADDADSRAIVESIIAMARRLGIALIAEGVETREQADILRAAGCDMAQGFLFARPMPEDEFMALVARDAQQGRNSP